jgi:nucleoside-diphosphate-sugar epimerase
MTALFPAESGAQNILTILVTGATGFVGTHLCAGLTNRSVPYRGTSRHGGGGTVGLDVTGENDWDAILGDIDVVVHLAAHVHVMGQAQGNFPDQHARTNTSGTIELACRAAERGVSRFVFVSSVKVFGEETALNAPFRADTPPGPQDPYSRSKLDAENALFELGARTGMEVVVLRPPLVYGQGVRANFRSLVQLVRSGLPLPFGSVANQRSLIGVGNLVDLIILCLHQPGAANQIFLASDGEDLSTPELLRRIALALGSKPKLFAIPPGILEASAGLLGQASTMRRLTRSLQIDMAATRNTLGWNPPIAIDDEIARAIQ